ncbi:MAG: PLP-dependent aminotransferase family protein [Clostridia bacterium]|jgi:2-aminoadipate transaminase|nr:PLP-dependent aminotransferase family protein [Clostridia bacterium]
MQPKFADRMANMNGTATREIFKLLSRPEIISFAGGLPAKECLPLKEIADITQELLASADVSLLQYGTTEGFLSLRQRLVEYVRDVGITGIDTDNTLVISGGQQGIDLLSKALLNKGDVVLVEDPTYLAVLPIIDSYEGRAVGVKACAEGLDLDDLEKKIVAYKPKLLYVVPTFSNPTGRTYTEENRKAIAKLTAKYGVIVLEDDPYGKLRFSGKAVPSLKSFDADNNVVYISSFSKIISPGLRVGVAVGDKAILRKMAIGKQGTDLHTSNLAQKIVEKYLEKGYLTPNIEKSLPLYLRRKTAMIDAIEKYMPAEFRHTDPDGGLFIWGELPAGVDTVKLLPAALECNVAYIQGQVFYADGSGLNTIRLNYSNADPEQIDKGIHALGDLLKKKLSEVK